MCVCVCVRARVVVVVVVVVAAPAPTPTPATPQPPAPPRPPQQPLLQLQPLPPAAALHHLAAAATLASAVAPTVSASGVRARQVAPATPLETLTPPCVSQDPPEAEWHRPEHSWNKSQVASRTSMDRSTKATLNNYNTRMWACRLQTIHRPKALAECLPEFTLPQSILLQFARSLPCVLLLLNAVINVA